MRSVVAAVLASSLIVSSALAQTAAPLPAGKPAGVRKADLSDTTTIALLTVAGLIGLSVGLLTSSTRNSVTPGVTSQTTTTAANP